MTDQVERVARALYKLSPVGVREWQDCPHVEAAGHRAQARAAIAAMDPPWRPIETAPKDGPGIDVWVSGAGIGYRIADVRWKGYVNFPKHGDTHEHMGWCRETDEGEWLSVEFAEYVVTHWKPLPAPPGEEK